MGSLRLSLELVTGAQIKEVAYEITGTGMSPMSGAIDTNAPSATASVELFGLPPGDGHRVAMMATSVGGETSCDGSTTFDVEAGQVTSVMVTLHCKGAPVFGGVRIDGKLNVCAELGKVVVGPLQTSQGSAIDVRAGGSDAEGDAVAYRWTAIGSSFADPNDAETTFTCGESVEEEITIEVSDDEFEQCIDRWTVAVRCVDGGGGEPSWGNPILIETHDTGDASAPQVTVDPDGNVTAVWEQSDGTRTHIYANRSLADGAWGTPVRVSNGEGEASAPQVAADLDGNVTAVWQQARGPRTYDVYANRFQAGGSWGTAVRVNDDAPTAVEPQLAVDPNGNVMAVWSQGGVPAPSPLVEPFPTLQSTNAGIWANRYPAGGSWGTPVYVGFGPAFPPFGFPHEPQLAVDLNGNATVVWTFQYDAGIGHGPPYDGLICARRLGDGEPVAVLYDGQFVGVDSVGGPRVAADPAGNVTAVWWGRLFPPLGTDPTIGVLARRDPVDGSWEDVMRLDALDFSVPESGTPQLAIDPNGNAAVVWGQRSEIGGYVRVWSNHDPTDGPWGTPVYVGGGTEGNASEPQLAVDSEGNATVVWAQDDGAQRNVRSNRSQADGPWGTPALVSNGAGDATAPQVAVDPGGNATAVWQQSDATRSSIWANRFE